MAGVPPASTRGSQNQTNQKIRDLIRGRRRRTRNLAKIGGETHFSKSHGGRRERKGETEEASEFGQPSLAAPFRDIFRTHISGRGREARSTVRLSVADLPNFGLWAFWSAKRVMILNLVWRTPDKGSIVLKGTGSLPCGIYTITPSEDSQVPEISVSTPSHFFNQRHAPRVVRRPTAFGVVKRRSTRGQGGHGRRARPPRVALRRCTGNSCQREKSGGALVLSCALVMVRKYHRVTVTS